MPPENIRRHKKSRLFDVVLVPVQEGETPKSFRTSWRRLSFIGAVAFIVCVSIAFAILVFTPIAAYLTIPNPGLERRYGRQIVSLQQQLNQLVQDVGLLKDYNQQLRKALGEGSSGDSATVQGSGPSIVTDTLSPHNASSAPTEAQVQPVAHQDAPAMDETNGSVELGGSESFENVVTSVETGKGTFPLLQPVDGIVTQGFDPPRSHFGMDFAGKRGTPVYAAADGHVLFAGWTYDDGNMVIIAHDGGYTTVYKHNQSLLTLAQSAVRRGEIVALLGESGRTSSGPHLHFEVWRDGRPQDPNLYLLTPAQVRPLADGQVQ